MAEPLISQRKVVVYAEILKGIGHFITFYSRDFKLQSYVLVLELKNGRKGFGEITRGETEIYCSKNE